VKHQKFSSDTSHVILNQLKFQLTGLTMKDYWFWTWKFQTFHPVMTLKKIPGKLLSLKYCAIKNPKSWRLRVLIFRYTIILRVYQTTKSFRH